MLVLCLLGGCEGVITSDTPLLVPENASFRLPSGAQITGQTLDDNNVWARDERKARIFLVDGSYRLRTPDQPAPSPDRFLFRQIADGQYVVQASNDSEWAYALLVRADLYYLFTFNRSDQNCPKLSVDERDRLHAIVRNDRCYVASLRDLVGLLRYLRDRFPNPTSAFVVGQIAR
jgi:hypothetical protein